MLPCYRSLYVLRIETDGNIFAANLELCLVPNRTCAFVRCKTVSQIGRSFFGWAWLSWG
jgi:hypothetical protein